MSKPKSGVSRRGFIRGASIGTGVLGAGILDKKALAAPAAEGKFIGPGAVPITLKINGKPQTLTLEPRVTLLDALRNHLELTGAKRVCDRATCGACTVILNGKSVYSCTVLAIDAQGKDIQTIEGISNGKPHPVSEAFVNNDGQQCGYCTPGFVMAAKAFLDHNPNPSLRRSEDRTVRQPVPLRHLRGRAPGGTGSGQGNEGREPCLSTVGLRWTSGG